MNSQLLYSLSQRSIFFGTSSWKYEGWKGLVYKKDYPSTKRFEGDCLTEYAQTFPLVGVDHSYYSLPSSKTIKRYQEQTPDHFRFILKAPDALTLRYFPHISRHQKKAGQTNPHFLSINYFKENMIPVVSEFQPKLASLIFEFSHFRKGTIESGSSFLDLLAHFFSELNTQYQIPLGVEIRNRTWLVPRFFETLMALHVTPVLNSWTLMPSLIEQIQTLRVYDFPAVIFRLLLKPQVVYQEAVNRFSPYSKIQEPQVEVRKAIADFIKYRLASGKACYILVNNRFEGCAPLTIEGILAHLSGLD